MRPDAVKSAVESPLKEGQHEQPLEAGRRERLFRSSPRRRRAVRQFPCLALGFAIAAVHHQAALAQPSTTQDTGSASGGAFDLWNKVASRLQQFGPAGWLVLVLLVLLPWVVHEWDNLAKLRAAICGFWRRLKQAKNGQTPNNLPTPGGAGISERGFVGRQAQLQGLAQRIELPGARVFLTGMGGVGKSELALQYAYAAMDRHRGGIIRLDARGSFEGMASEVISFVRGKFPGLIPDEGDLKDLLPRCWSQWPATTNPPDPVLLILDDLIGNAEGYIAEQELCLGLPKRFHRLITQREDAPTGSMAIDLEVLDPDSARQLLQIQSGEQGVQRIAAERDAADALCAQVGFLPLALVLLGAHLAALPDLTMQQLLNSLKDKGAAATFLQQARPELAASRGVVESMLVSFEPLPKEAKELAILLAVMGPALIPWALAERCWDSEPDETETNRLRDASAVLLRSNLLERQQPGLYKLHPLVRQFLLLKGQEDEQLLTRCHRQLAEAITEICKEVDEKPSLSNLRDVEYYVPHVEEVAEAYSEHISNDNLVWPCTSLGRICKSQGLYQDALKWRQLCCEQIRNRQGLGPEDEAMATALDNLGQLHIDMGNLQPAEDAIREALRIDRRIFGRQHPKIAIRLNSLAQVLQDQEKLNEARRLMLRALAIDKADCKENPTLVALRLSNLGCLYLQMYKETHCPDHAEKAERTLRTALQLDETVSEEKGQKGVARDCKNLGAVLQDRHNLIEAEAFMRRALEMEIELYGREAISVACSRNNIARLLMQMHRNDEAEPLMRDALVSSLKRHGPSHSLTKNFEERYRQLLKEIGHDQLTINAKIRELTTNFRAQGK